MTDSLGRGRKAAGDLIPWNMCEQFGDKDFPKLSGARIVRIATHPSYQRVCYKVIITVIGTIIKAFLLE